MGRIVVVGGGVIGLCAAYSLRQRGADVTVIEARDGAHGASVVNAGWITPSLTEPVPAPGLVKTSIKWMAKGDSPLYIHPASAPKLAPWLIAFWRKCNHRDHLRGMEATSELARRTMQTFDEMKAAGVRYEEHQDGLLYAYQSMETLQKDWEALTPLNKFGYTVPPILDAQAVHDFDPVLGPSVSGGYWFQQDRSVRPDSLTSGLREWLEERNVEFRSATRVTGFDAPDGTVRAVGTTSGAIPCDGAVIAAGVWTGEVARLAGVKLPIQGGKGYCLDYTPAPQTFSRPLYLHEARVAVTPFDGGVRLAGTMEFSGINDIMRPKRVAALSRTASTMLKDFPADPKHATRIGNGLRPMTPDGLPVIGLLRGHRNLAVASGHAMLGVTLGTVTGEAVAETVLTGTAPEVVRPFDPGRFA